MVRMIILAIVITLGLTSCNGQVAKDNNPEKKTNVPNTDVKVNKEYDEKGNLIRYDSTYSSYYSNVVNDSILMDSIFGNFKNYFNHKYFFSKQPYFDDFFFQDSLLPYDFYKEDFFSNRFRDNMERMDHLFWEMDSIKDEFFKDQFKPKTQK